MIFYVTFLDSCIFSTISFRVLTIFENRNSYTRVDILLADFSDCVGQPASQPVGQPSDWAVRLVRQVRPAGQVHRARYTALRITLILQRKLYFCCAFLVRIFIAYFYKGTFLFT